jgi:DNA-binding NarL/FixJ family response regulator
MHDSEEYVLEALNADAYGYLLKDTDKEEFLKALRAVHGGSKYYTGAVSHVLANRLLQGQGQRTTRREEVTPDPYNLSKREKQILRMVIDGRHNKEIAEALEKSQRTIETHRFNIMKKLGVNNAIDMVNKAVRENIA